MNGRTGRDSTGNPSPSPLRSPITLDDLFADLTWPMLLKAAALACRPARLGIALFFVAAVGTLVTLAQHLDGVENHNVIVEMADRQIATLDEFLMACWDLNPAGAAAAFRALTFDNLNTLNWQGWVAILFAGIPAAVLMAIAGGAISRSVAVENARAGELTWTRALAFGLSRWVSSFGAMIVPKIAVFAIALGLAIAGIFLLTVPVINMLGGVLFGLALLIGFVAVLVMLVYVFVWPLLIPAVACDGSDAIDAMQRAYSFFFARPLRLLIYTAIVGVQFAIVMFVAVLLAGATIFFTQASTSLAMEEGGRAAAVVNGHPSGNTKDAKVFYWEEINAEEAAAAREKGEIVVSEAGDFDDNGKMEDDEIEYKVQRELTGASGIAHGMIRFWCFIPFALVAAYGVSFFFTGATLLYLAMRKAVDGQDPDEIWTSDPVPFSAAAASPAPSTASEAVTDDGPADEG